MRGLLLCGVLVGAVLFSKGPVHAQSVSYGEDARTGYKTATSALVALLGDDSVAAGSYRLKGSSQEAPDAELDLYKALGEFSLVSPESDFVPLLEVSPSLLHLKQNVVGGEFPGGLEIDSWAVSGGVGLRMNLIGDSLQITPRFKAQYSEVDYDISFEGVDNALVDTLVPDVTAWTYIPSLEVVYRYSDSKCRDLLNVESHLSLVYVDASTTRSGIDDFLAHSWVWKNRITTDRVVSLGASLGDVVIRPSIGRVGIGGAAKDGLGFNDFYEFGTDVLSREIGSNVFQEIGFGVTYAYAKEIQGWRFGVIAKFS